MQYRTLFRNVFKLLLKSTKYPPRAAILGGIGSGILALCGLRGPRRRCTQPNETGAGVEPDASISSLWLSCPFFVVSVETNEVVRGSLSEIGK